MNKFKGVERVRRSLRVVAGAYIRQEHARPRELVSKAATHFSSPHLRPLTIGRAVQFILSRSRS